jgi:hypothetical protein
MSEGKGYKGQGHKQRGSFSNGGFHTAVWPPRITNQMECDETPALIPVGFVGHDDATREIPVSVSMSSHETTF